MNWEKATLQQLITIIKHEDCPIIYKYLAEDELEKRLNRTIVGCGSDEKEKSSA
jgi:hypothetical protein